MICLGGAGSSACMGDSGGPLVCEENGRWFLRGAASFVKNKQCPKNNYSVYARVSSYIDWISDKIGKWLLINCMQGGHSKIIPTGGGWG